MSQGEPPEAPESAGDSKPAAPPKPPPKPAAPPRELPSQEQIADWYAGADCPSIDNLFNNLVVMRFDALVMQIRKEEPELLAPAARLTRFSSSPILVDGKVVVQCDVQGQSFVAAFDAATGEELWRTERDEVPTFGSPTVYEHAGRKIVAVNGWRHIGAYDLATGAEVWRVRVFCDIPTTTPVVAHGYIYITNAHGNLAPICAVRTDARGAIDLADGQRSSDGIAWCHFRDGAYMQTPIVVGDVLYVCRDNGVLGAYDAISGEENFRERLCGGGTSGLTGSAVAANGLLYYSNETGDVFVVKAGREFELVTTNAMDEIVMATPAIADGVIYFRTRGHVVAIGDTS